LNLLVKIFVHKNFCTTKWVDRNNAQYRIN